MKKIMGGLVLMGLMATFTKPAVAVTCTEKYLGQSVGDPHDIAILYAGYLNSLPIGERFWARVFTLPTGNGPEVNVWGLRCVP